MPSGGCAADPRLELERLARKYETLVVLRGDRARVEALGLDRFPPGEGALRKRRFRRLAREFPGSLRELDTSSPERLEGRLLELRGVLARGSCDVEPIPRWMGVCADYHRTLRLLLRIKLWLACRVERGAVALPPAVVRSFEGRVERWERLAQGSAASLRPLPEELERIFQPPKGRILELVWEALESRHGLDRTVLEALIFGP